MDEEIRRRALAEGAVDFLYKPFDGEVLLRSISRALQRA
jgi:FixJ family two-component response regulator